MIEDTVRQMTFDEARAIVDRVSHPFMLFTLERVGDEFFPAPAGYLHAKLRISHKCADAATLQPIVINRGRRLMLHERTTESELVDEVWRCVKNAALHEAGEYFKYKGKAIHFPHDVAAV